MTSGDATDLLGGNAAVRGLHALDSVVLDIEAGNFAVLDDVDAKLRSGAGKTPSDGVVARDASGLLARGAEHRVARRFRGVEDGDAFAHLLGVEHFGVDAVDDVGADAALDIAHILQAMAEVVDAALREQHVVIELGAEIFPELERVVVEQRGFGPKVIGADDGGVATGVAAAQIALFEHGDVAHSVLFGEIVGSGETVAAAADDDGVVLRARLLLGPSWLPALIATERLADEGEC